MIKILANDGIDYAGKALLEQAGFLIEDARNSQEELLEVVKNYDVLVVRSATEVRKNLIDAASNLKLIARGGVGLDNIDVNHAHAKGLAIINTPTASSLSVAELVFAHLFAGARLLHQSNRRMPLEGATEFHKLKREHAQGIELRGKTIGIIGFGRIGQETAKIALRLGMNVLAYDLRHMPNSLELSFSGNIKVVLPIQQSSLEGLIRASDFISIHTPALKQAILGEREFEVMKKGVCIINCARGGSIDEHALLSALNAGKVAFAGFDVFENEPQPNQELLLHPQISLSPHIGASTKEAQERVGVELAQAIINFFESELR